MTWYRMFIGQIKGGKNEKKSNSWKLENEYVAK